MGGGGGGGDTITNTGLGDDQYQTLADNQAGISGQITTARDDADEAYGNIYNRFDQSRDRQNAMSDAIGTKGQTFDFSGFSDGVTLSDSLAALKQSVGLQEQDLKYDVNGDGVVDRRDGEGMMSNIVGLDPSTVDSGLYKEFSDQNKNLTDQFGNVTTQFGDLTRDLGTQATNITSNVGTQLDSLGTTLGGRFDTVDTNVGANLDAIGGVSDQVTDVQTTADTIDTNTEGLSGSLEDLSDAQGDRFDTVDDAVETGFGDAQTNRDDLNSDAQDSRDTIIDDLDTLAGDQGDYFDSLSGDIGDVKTETEGFVSNFDDYVDRYDDDVDTANETRSDILSGQETAYENLRDDLGEYTQAVSGYASDTDAAMETGFDGLGSTVEGGFEAVEEDMGEGFSDTEDAIESEVDGLDLQTRLNAVTEALGGDISTLDADIMAEFGDVAGAFDDQGQLIEDEIADNGDLITREIDGQGSMIERRFDAQGTQIGETETNLNDALSAVESSLGMGMEGMSGDISGLFDSQNATLSDQGSQLLSLGMNMEGLSDQQKADFQAVSGAFDAQGNLIRTGQDAMGNLVEREMDANGQMLERKFDDQGNLLGETSLNVNDVMSGLGQLDTIQGSIQQGFEGVQDSFGQQEGMMSEMSQEQQSQFEQTQSQIDTGFDATAGVMDTQVRDIADVASQMTDLDMGMRQEFYQLGGAFDDNGELIKETVDENGNAVQRSIDVNGNLMLRAFDQTGNAIGQNVININKALGDLASIEAMPGASVSMGNLSPAMQASPRQGQPNVPTSGFMSPYSQTV